MTPDEYRQVVDAIGWSSEEVARRLGVTSKRAQRWRSGNTAVPEPVAAWLRRLAHEVERNPPPAKP